MEEAVVDHGATHLVGEYMTSDVTTVALDDSVDDVVSLIDDTGHDGFPVCDDRRVQGFVSARDLLLAPAGSTIRDAMSRELIVAHPDMAVTDAARVILRSGIQKLPVVDDDRLLVGIISNADVVRSQIERATPEKVGKLRRTIESIHDIETRQERRTVRLDELTPTQTTVYADELEGRSYELERGLAEPLVVIDSPGALLLADGHHRMLAADRLGREAIDAYVIVVEADVELGMARGARRDGLHSLEDVGIEDYARHPLVETVERLQ